MTPEKLAKILNNHLGKNIVIHDGPHKAEIDEVWVVGGEIEGNNGTINISFVRKETK